MQFAPANPVGHDFTTSFACQGPGCCERAKCINHANGDKTSGRFSRLASAQGVGSLSISQDVVILLVGAGGTVSAVSPMLVRNGHKQMFLDVDTVEAHNTLNMTC